LWVRQTLKFYLKYDDIIYMKNIKECNNCLFESDLSKTINVGELESEHDFNSDEVTLCRFCQMIYGVD